ncbi:MAG: hypothetical protein ACOYLP_00515 [Flavobacterium sp.]|uniref:hypothetical protein n=1 Tax=Flavobacterium sp. TaxID=239 RepID=UPI003BCC82D7
MSATSQNNDDQEIDLSQISKKIGNFFENISISIFRGILFFKRNIIWVGILFGIGVGIGFYLDKTTKVYDNEIILSPNFGSNDYLYSKVDLLKSKIKDRDTLFLKSIGLKNTQKLVDIELEPIVDVYKFIDNKATNFELIKLMAEDGEINKIVKDNMTSKNYPFHLLKLTTIKALPADDIVNPLLNYINDSEYFKLNQKGYLNNIKIKMAENDSIITQINGVLKKIINNNGSSKSNSLVYYNDNMQLNDIIKTKDALVTEQGIHRLELINFDKILKDISIVTNVKNTKGANGKMKYILPTILLMLFIFIKSFISFYKKQLAKSKVK